MFLISTSWLPGKWFVLSQEACYLHIGLIFFFPLSNRLTAFPLGTQQGAGTKQPGFLLLAGHHVSKAMRWHKARCPIAYKGQTVFWFHKQFWKASRWGWMIDNPGIKTIGYKILKAALLSISNVLNMAPVFGLSGNASSWDTLKGAPAEKEATVQHNGKQPWK